MLTIIRRRQPRRHLRLRTLLIFISLFISVLVVPSSTAFGFSVGRRRNNKENFVVGTILTTQRPTPETIHPKFAPNCLVSTADIWNHDYVNMTHPMNTQHPRDGYTTLLEKGDGPWMPQIQVPSSSSSKQQNVWRVLKFTKCVGSGRDCYERVKEAALEWDFEASFDNDSVVVGMMSLPHQGEQQQHHKHMVTYTKTMLPKLYAVSPVQVVYNLVDCYCYQPQEDDGSGVCFSEQEPDPNLNATLFTSTAYATRQGHWIAGEERVSVILHSSNNVFVELCSISRAGPSKRAKLVWPFVGRPQQRFFAAQLEWLNHCASARVE